MKQENLIEQKKEVLIKLVDLGVDAKKAQKIIDTILSQNQNINKEKIIEVATAKIENDRIKKQAERKKKKQEALNLLDIRTIVEQGKKDNKSAYEAIKNQDISLVLRMTFF